MITMHGYEFYGPEDAKDYEMIDTLVKLGASVRCLEKKSLCTLV